MGRFLAWAAAIVVSELCSSLVLLSTGVHGQETLLQSLFFKDTQARLNQGQPMMRGLRQLSIDNSIRSLSSSSSSSTSETNPNNDGSSSTTTTSSAGKLNSNSTSTTTASKPTTKTLNPVVDDISQFLDDNYNVTRKVLPPEKDPPSSWPLDVFGIFVGAAIVLFAATAYKNYKKRKAYTPVPST